MNISPKVWGKSYWFVIYTTAMTYSDQPTAQEKADTKTLLLAIGKRLPCDSCRHNFRDHIRKHPLNDDALRRRENLIRWAVAVHNEVNRTTGQKDTSYEEQVAVFQSLYRGEKPQNSLRLYTLIAVVVFVIVLSLVRFCYK